MTETSGSNALTAKIKKIYCKMVKRTFYKIALLILGLPTYIIVFFVNCLRLNEQTNEYKKLKKSIEEDFSKNNLKQVIYDEVRQSEHQRLKYFNKGFDEKKFDSTVNEIADRQINEIIEEETKKRAQQDGVAYFDINGAYCDMIENRLFLILSVIISLPMYALILIYSNPYVKYIFERTAMMIFVIFGVTVLVFTILYISPSDPALNILGPKATEQQVENFYETYGLDKPYIVQVLKSFKSIITFDLGKSYVGNEDILPAILRKFPITLKLTAASLLIAIVIAIPAGIVSAIRQYSSLDYILMFIALIGLSIPNFWLGLILILNFSIKLNWLPATFSAENWVTLVMPAIVLGTGLSASVARMTRSSMLEVKFQDYVMTAKAKGLSEGEVIIRHILSNAMIPIVTVIGLQFGGLLAGSAVTEKVFNVNGIGSYIVDKQFVPDIPVVLAGVVYVAIVISLVNLAVDLLYAFLDPRIKSKLKSY